MPNWRDRLRIKWNKFLDNRKSNKVIPCKSLIYTNIPCRQYAVRPLEYCDYHNSIIKIRNHRQFNYIESKPQILYNPYENLPRDYTVQENSNYEETSYEYVSGDESIENQDTCTFISCSETFELPKESKRIQTEKCEFCDHIHTDNCKFEFASKVFKDVPEYRNLIIEKLKSEIDENLIDITTTL